MCSALPLAGLAAEPVVITSNLTIAESDTTYDGADLVISGAVTVAINGAHSFNSLTLTNGATLTHSACTATETYKLDLTVANDVVLTADTVPGNYHLVVRTDIGNHTRETVEANNVAASEALLVSNCSGAFGWLR